MAKIKKTDLFDANIFTGTKTEVENLIVVVKQLKTEMLSLLKTSQKALQKRPDNSAAIRKQAEETQKVSQAEKNLIQLEKERIKLVNKLNGLQTKEAQNNARSKVRIQERNKALKQQAREELKLVGAYEKQSRTLIKLRKRYKDLVIAGKGSTKQAIAMRKEVGRLDAQLKKADASAGQYQRNVGNYGNKLKAGFGSIMGAVGLTAGLTGAFRIVQNGIKSVKEFEKAGANLAAVLIKTRKEGETWQESISKLTADAKRLGATTVFTAKQVTELQTSLARLGFGQQDIINITASTLDASAAMGSSLEEQADLTGAVLKAFQLDTSQAAEVNDVLAASTSASALSFEKLKTALPTVAPVANAVGVSLQRTTATLGKLVDNGLDASTAATGLRNVFLELQKQGITYDQALDKIANSTNKAKTSLELFGKRGATIGVILENSRIGVDELEVSLNNAGGTAQEMAETQLDTLDGALTLLGSTWDGFIQNLAEGGSQFLTLKDIIQFVTRNFDTLIRTIKIVAIAFLSYKAAIIATNVVTKLYRAGQIAARIATIAMSHGLKGATRAMKLFNTSIKSNPIGLIVSGLTTAIALLWDYGDAADDAADSTDAIADATERLKGIQEANFKALSQNIQQNIANIDLEIAKLKEKGATQKEIDDLVIKRSKLQTADAEARIKLIEETNAALQKQVESGKLEDLPKVGDEYTDEEGNRQMEKFTQGYYVNNPMGPQGFNLTAKEMKSFQKERNRIMDENRQAAKMAMIDNDKQLTQLKIQLDLQETQLETELINNKLQKTKSKRTKTKVIENKYAADLLEIERSRLRVLRKIQQIETENQLENNLKETNETIDKLIEKAGMLDNVDSDGNQVLDQSFKDDVNETLRPEYNARLDLEKKQIQDTAAFENDVLLERFTDAENKYKAQYKKKELSEKEYLDVLNRLNQKYVDEQDKIEKDKNAKLEQAYKDNEIAFEESQKRILDEAQLTIDKQIEDLKKIEEQRLTELQQTLEAVNAMMDWLQRQNDKRVERQLANIDKEIEASKNRADELRKLSVEGNSDAEKSLLAEERRQNELELQKKKKERNQQLFNAGIAAFKVFAAKVESGDKNPLGSTIKDITSLTAFISNLPAFYEGTENVGQSLGKPMLNGRDGHVVRVDSKERIVDPLNNAKLNGLTNDEIGALALNYKSQKMDGIKYNKIGSSTYETMANSMALNYQLSNKLDDLNRSNKKIIQAIEHIPQESWDYDKMSDAVVQKVATQRKIEYKHYNNKNLF